MNSWVIVACFIAVVSASPSGYGLHGHGHGVVVHGPSGVVSEHGPVGPTGPASGHDDGHYYGDDGDDGSYHGEGAYGHGGYGHGGYGYGGHGAVLGHGVAVIAPSAHAVVSGPAHGYGFGHGGFGHGFGGYGGHGHGAGYVALGHHGVTVHGPHTVPAVVAGPSGKIVADGLYGVPHHHHY